jgi:hypothetical protein
MENKTYSDAISILNTLSHERDTLVSDDLTSRVQDGMPTAELHAFYNIEGMNEGWLKPEYATPLSAQDDVNKEKNIGAALDVINYWIGQFDETTDFSSSNSIVDRMKSSIDYESNRGLTSLEEAAESQHNQWRRFVNQHQKERINPNHKEFRQSNYEQFQTDYANLEESVKDQDRLIVAVVTDVVLGLANIGYERKIDTSQTFI